MRKRRIYLTTIIWAALLVRATIIATADTPELKLTPPPAPFAEANAPSQKPGDFTPSIEGDKIISGNKSLYVTNGGLSLFAGDNQKPIKINFGFQTDFGYSSWSQGKDISNSYDAATQNVRVFGEFTF